MNVSDTDSVPSVLFWICDYTDRPRVKSDGSDLNRSSNTIVVEYAMGIVELWTLYAFAVSFTCLRTYARITAVSLRKLQVDDYLVWIAIVSSNQSLVAAFCHAKKQLIRLSTPPNAASGTAWECTYMVSQMMV